MGGGAQNTKGPEWYLPVTPSLHNHRYSDPSGHLERGGFINGKVPPKRPSPNLDDPSPLVNLMGPGFGPGVDREVVVFQGYDDDNNNDTTFPCKL